MDLANGVHYQLGFGQGEAALAGAVEKGQRRGENGVVAVVESVVGEKKLISYPGDDSITGAVPSRRCGGDGDTV